MAVSIVVEKTTLCFPGGWLFGRPAAAALLPCWSVEDTESLKIPRNGNETFFLMLSTLSFNFTWCAILQTLSGLVLTLNVRFTLMKFLDHVHSAHWIYMILYHFSTTSVMRHYAICKLSTNQNVNIIIMRCVNPLFNAAVDSSMFLSQVSSLNKLA